MARRGSYWCRGSSIPYVFGLLLLACFTSSCTTELDSEGVLFACDSEADCADGYACLATTTGRKVCQDPDTYQMPDVGDADVTDTDANSGDVTSQDSGDTGPDATAECEIGSQEACPCTDLPIEVQGQRDCSEDEEWGECECPATCVEFTEGIVAEGTECGLCGAGVYTCNEQGQAQCTEPTGVNDCGGCADHGPAVACGDQDLICVADESTECVDSQTTILEFEEAQFLDEGVVRYAFFEVENIDGACDAGWELPFAAARSVVFRRAERLEDGPQGEFRYEIDIPTETSLESVLRVVFEQELDLYEHQAPAEVATHFGCRDIDVDDDVVNLEVHLHPFLFHGEYTLAFEGYNPLQYDSEAHEFDWVWTHIARTWVFDTLYDYLSEPANIFMGCEDTGCPGSTVDGLLGRYDVFRAEADVPNLSFWSEFYGDFQDFLQDLDDIEDFRAVYRSLFDDHIAETASNIANIDTRYNSFFDDDGYMKVPKYKFPFGRIHFASSPDAAGNPNAQIDVTRTSLISTLPFSPECLSTGMQVSCISPPSAIDNENPGSSIPEFNFAADLSQVTIGSIQVHPQEAEILDYFFYEYYPSQVYPAVKEVAVGEDEVDYGLDSWESLSEMYSTIAPCSEVVDGLEDRGVEASLAEQFAPICDDLYGDPDGRRVLKRMRDLIPMVSYYWNSINLSSTEACVPEFAADPIHGIRLRHVYNGTESNICAVPSASTGFASVSGGVSQGSLGPWRVSLHTDFP